MRSLQQEGMKCVIYTPLGLLTLASLALASAKLARQAGTPRSMSFMAGSKHAQSRQDTTDCSQQHHVAIAA